MAKLTVVLEDETMEWLRLFAQRHGQSMGEVVRIELDALRQNDLASAALQRAADPSVYTAP